MAQRGTLFLDEIGELPLASQAKLLRVLEERRFERVGGTQSIDVDVRIVVATNRTLPSAFAKNISRRSLLPYFRCSLVILRCAIAVTIFFSWPTTSWKNSARICQGPLTLSADAAASSAATPGPQRARASRTPLERAAILSNGSEITPDLLPAATVPNGTDAVPANLLSESFNWEGSLEDVTTRAQLHVERVLIENALKECRWDKTRAAEKLQVTPKRCSPNASHRLEN